MMIKRLIPPLMITRNGQDSSPKGARQTSRPLPLPLPLPLQMLDKRKKMTDLQQARIKFEKWARSHKAERLSRAKVANAHTPGTPMTPRAKVLAKRLERREAITNLRRADYQRAEELAYNAI